MTGPPCILGGTIPITMTTMRGIVSFLFFLLLLFALYSAYTIRLYSIQEYGMIIHEFDPWFNFRATQYLSDNGWNAFFQWYDYMSWYPLGRPVGTTIFPGMQITSVLIHEALKMLGVNMSLNDVCVYIPAWFGSVATLLTALIAYEVSRSISVTAIAAYLFAIIPAHLMRSMAGEYDNECIAMSAMLATFYTWVRALRGPGSWPIGVLAGLAYGYMVSTWGGYVFVINMVAMHAGACVLVDWARNQYNVSLLKAYSLFYVVGTALATRVPPVGMAPFRSLEQLMPLLLFILMWALHFSERLRKRANAEVLSAKTLRIRSRVLVVTLGVLMLLAVVIAPTGYFGPISSRVRALFVQHTQTGNPLVDSVAEHRPSSPEAYWTYLHVCYLWWVFGFLFATVMGVVRGRPALTFMVLYSLTAFYFSAKMSRLMLLTGPAATILTGYIIGSTCDLAMASWFQPAPGSNGAGQSKKQKQKQHNPNPMNDDELLIMKEWKQTSRDRPMLSLLILGSIVFACAFSILASGYSKHCALLTESFSHPHILFEARLPNGRPFVVDDYYVSYLWLRDNTPEDARVLSWWDYGYQITGIGNRTTLADGNTWNHEHIATIGKMLTSPVKEAHSIIRHLADYVLIWCGRGGDLLKSPHMARIGNSVYRDICPKEDPLCANFGFYDQAFSQPTPMMKSSLLYNLHGNMKTMESSVDSKLFELAYVSKYGLVKIFRVMNVSQESKRWLADPKNRKCDAPGSWLCAGQYPPAKEIQDLLANRIDFAQLEDFIQGKRDDAYHRAYMRRIRQGG